MHIIVLVRYTYGSYIDLDYIKLWHYYRYFLQSNFKFVFLEMMKRISRIDELGLGAYVTNVRHCIPQGI